MRIGYFVRVGTGVVIALILLSMGSATHSQWPGPAERTGLMVPAPRNVRVRMAVDGAYVPQVSDLASGRTFVFQGEGVWNFGLVNGIGLVGRHTVGRMGWSHVRLVTLGNEVGFRFRPFETVAFELLYLTHRVDVTRVDGYRIYPAGVVDHGVELGVWAAPLATRRIRLDAHLFGRVFRVYSEHHLVLGTGVRLRLLPADGHELRVDGEFLEIWRHGARVGVDRFTHNTMGSLSWYSMVSAKIGVMASVRLSLNLLSGEVPMLELKRSMIGEPMGLLSIGLFSDF